MLVLLPITVSLSVTFFVYAVLGRRGQTVRDRLRALRPDHYPDEGPDFSLPFLERAVYPAVEGLLNVGISLMPPGLLDRLNRRLMTAGSPISLRGLLVVWFGLPLALGALVLVLLVVSGLIVEPAGVFFLFVVMGVGAMLPYLWLTSTIRGRQRAILKILPDAMDLVTTSVEAGLGLDAALSRMADRIGGPLAEELSRALREMAMGRLRRDALEEMGQRMGVEELITFINAVIQAEQMGVSLGHVLRVQSDQLRVRRRQRAEEEAQRAPVKMIFPLVLGVFPALLIVILGPAAIQLFQNLGD